MTLQTIELLTAAAEKPSTFVTVLVPVVIFLSVSAVTGVITFRVKTKKLKKLRDDKESSEKEEDHVL